MLTDATATLPAEEVSVEPKETEHHSVFRDFIHVGSIDKFA